MKHRIKPIPLTDEQIITLDTIIEEITRKINYMTDFMTANPIVKLSVANHIRRQRYIYIHDVLAIHNYRKNNKELFLQEERSWQTELDVPKEAYEDVIDDVIKSLTSINKDPFTNQTENQRKQFENQIHLLHQLKSYRETE